MSNETICKVTRIRREVCKVMDMSDCRQEEPQEERVCATPEEAQRKLSKLCGSFYSGMGLAALFHKAAWSCDWKKS